MSVSFSYLSEGKHPSGLELLASFTFINFFLKILIKNIIYCQTVHVFGQFMYVRLFCLHSNILPAMFCLDQDHCQIE